MDCNQPGSSVHGISQARILEWVMISFSRGSSQPGDWTRFLHCRYIRYYGATREPLGYQWEVYILKVKVVQLSPTLCNSMDYTVHESLKARILEWVSLPFSRGPSQCRGRTQVSCIAGRFFTSWITRTTNQSIQAGMQGRTWSQINFPLYYLKPPTSLVTSWNKIEEITSIQTYLESLAPEVTL